MRRWQAIPIQSISSVWEGPAILGEGPYWSETENCIYFVDIKSGQLMHLDPATGRVRTWYFDDGISCIGPGATSGYFFAAFRNNVGIVNLETGAQEILFTPPSLVPTQRFNDGKVDRYGALWAGTMDDAEQADIGAFFRISPDGHAETIAQGFGVTNGPAFAPDGETVYLTDSKARTIYRARYDFERSRLLTCDEFIRLDPDEGYPDGMTCDEAGNIWVACWDGWGVRAFSPDGARVGWVRLPVQRPTCPIFTPDFKSLYVTSATVGLCADDLSDQPLAGHLIRIDL